MATEEYIPLPRVHDFTDRVYIESLGLPTGFREQQLGINVARVERVMDNAGVASMIVSSTEEPHTVADTLQRRIMHKLCGVEDIAGPQVKRKLVEVTTDSEYYMPNQFLFDKENYRYPGVSLVLDSVLKEQMIDKQATTWGRGVYEPAAQAYYANRALRKGLRMAATDKHLTGENMIASTGIIAAGDIAAGGANTATQCAILGGLVVGMSAFNVSQALLLRARKDLPLRARHWSAFVGVPFDRHAKAVQLSQRTLVKALG